MVIIPTMIDRRLNDPSPEESLNITAMLDNSLEFLSSLAEGGFILPAVKLLVTVSAIMNPSDWSRIAPLVWYRGLSSGRIDENPSRGRGCSNVSGNQEPKALVCFLVMQCAEKNSQDFRAMVEQDMQRQDPYLIFVCVLRSDVFSPDGLIRLESIHKLSLLVNWRFQIMSESHNILVDRTHRSFKLARAPLPFVRTDMGSPNYVYNDANRASVFTLPGVTSTQASGGNASRSRKGKIKKDVIPDELKKQLVEIGWVDDDDKGDENELWIRTPLSLLPVNYMERLDLQRTSEPGPTPVSSPTLTSPTMSSGGQLTPLITSSPSSPVVFGGKVDRPGEGSLLRRNSSSGGPTYAKRRPLFVPPLSLVFRILATMVFDPNLIVASAARDTLLDMMRNDPLLLLRPMLDLFCDDQGHGYEESAQDIRQAINIFTALLHTQHMIPPPAAHMLFNDLAGLLKYTFRQTDPSAAERDGNTMVSAATGDSLTTFALAVPIMARLAMYVGDLTMREIKKSKMEHFLIPYGSLWFDHVGVPSGPMFPRGLNLGNGLGGQYAVQVNNPFDLGKAETRGEAVTIVGLDSRLVKVVMIRIAQNMMFVEMLKKSAQDVVSVRKTMPKFVAPKLDGDEKELGRSLELNDFVPITGEKPYGPDEPTEKKTLSVLSLALARSYITLVAQVFRSMSRNSNDRDEMAKFVLGLNQILLAHGDDIGIVGHVLIGKSCHSS